LPSFCAAFLALSILLLSACRKQLLPEEENDNTGTAVNQGRSLSSQIDSLNDIGFFIKNRPNPDVPLPGRELEASKRLQLLGQQLTEQEYPDEVQMVLGAQLPNPYSIPNMTAAYNTYFNLNLPYIQTTHLYVRFAPTSEAQVALLDDSLDLELFTHPLDYEVLIDGDIYVHAGKSIEDLPFLYTVVLPSFNFPAGVPYTVLAPIHIPEGDLAPMIEEFAESLVLGAQYSSESISNNELLITREDVTLQNGTHPQLIVPDVTCYEYDQNGAIYIVECPVDDPPPPPTPMVCGLPALGCINPGFPRGRVRVRDTQLGICEPLVDVKIRAKNWFRIKNTRTDAQGMFAINHAYKRRVKINLIFRNDELSVRPLRNKVGIRLSLFPITHRLGVYRDACEMNKVEKIFERNIDRESKAFEAWMAANAINSRREQRIFAESPAEGIKAMKDFRLNLYLVKHGLEYFSGPQAELLMQNYLWRNRQALDWIIEASKLAMYYAANDVVGATVTLINNVLGTQRADIMYSYNTHPDDRSRSLENLSSNEVKQKFYDVFTQAGILKATDNNVKWKNYFKLQSKFIDAGAGFLGTTLKELNKKLKITKIDLPGAPPTSPVSGYASVASMATTLLQHTVYALNAPDREYFEMVNGFGEFYGHRMCHIRYGSLSDPLYDQKRQIIVSAGVASSHLRYLENWQPNVEVDINKNLRIGLFHDCIDLEVDRIRPEQLAQRERDDLVSNISMKQMFYSFTGSGSSGGLLQWGSPQEWIHFADNTAAQAASQSASLNNLFIAYLIR
jgi:hypothetical protein